MISDEPYLKGWRQAPDGAWLSPEQQRELPPAPPVPAEAWPPAPARAQPPARRPAAAPAASAPVPAPVAPPGRPAGQAPATGRRWETWHVLVVAVVALLIGFGLGARGNDDAQDVVRAGAGTTLPDSDLGSDLSIPLRTFPGETSPTSPTTAATRGSSRTAPMALRQEGRPATLQWSVRVTDVTPDAGAAIHAENRFNTPPEAGRQFFMATIELTYRGPDSDAPTAVDLEAVGASNVVYRWSRDSCGVIPKPYSQGNRVFTGGVVQGNVCWSVKSEDAASLVMIAHAIFSERDPIYFALR